MRHKWWLLCESVLVFTALCLRLWSVCRFKLLLMSLSLITPCCLLCLLVMPTVAVTRHDSHVHPMMPTCDSMPYWLYILVGFTYCTRQTVHATVVAFVTTHTHTHTTATTDDADIINNCHHHSPPKWKHTISGRGIRILPLALQYSPPNWSSPPPSTEKNKQILYFKHERAPNQFSWSALTNWIKSGNLGY